MKTLLKFCTAFSFLFLTLASSAQSGPQMMENNWANSMGRGDNGLCVQLLMDNLLTIHINVYTAVEDLTAAPEMTLKYNFNDEWVGFTDAIRSFNMTAVNVNGHSLYQTSFAFTFDMSHHCDDMFNRQDFPFTYSFELYDISDKFNPVIFPVHDYPNIFPPHIFTALNDPAYQPTYSGAKQICCHNRAYLQHTASEKPNVASYNENNQLPVIRGEEEATSAESEAAVAFFTETMVEVFPNPFRDNIDVELHLSKASEAEYVLLDAKGRRTYQYQAAFLPAGSHRHTIQSTGLAPGIYFLQIRTDNFTQTRRIVKFE